MRQAVQRIDHIAIIVKQENAARYADRLGRILGVTFDGPHVSTSGSRNYFAWEAGLEITAPRPGAGVQWERLQRFGEGSVNIVFGVADLDDGVERAEANGASPGLVASVDGDEPWLAPFSSFREVRLDAFDDEDLSCSFVLSEIVPVHDEGDPG